MHSHFKPDCQASDTHIGLMAALKSSALAISTTVVSRHYCLHAVACDTPFLIIPLTGHKRFHVGSKTWECHTSLFLMSHFALHADIENFPDENEPYRAWVIPFSWDVVESARSILTDQQIANSKPSTDLVSVGMLHSIECSLLSYLKDGDSPDIAIRNYRLLGILLDLFSAGHSQFILAKDQSLSSRIRVAVSAEPSREWTSAYFEEIFFVSGATLRRRLVAEGTSLRKLIQEARLHSALIHLQTSMNPLKTVASAHGYRSVTAFRRNFTERFGLDPVDCWPFDTCEPHCLVPVTTS